MSRKRGEFRWTRARRRVLLALLSGAGNLSIFPVCRAAQAGSGTVVLVLAHLERLGWVTSEQFKLFADPVLVRRFYHLTPEGRAAALKVLGLTETRELAYTGPTFASSI